MASSSSWISTSSPMVISLSVAALSEAGASCTGISRFSSFCTTLEASALSDTSRVLSGSIWFDLSAEAPSSRIFKWNGQPRIPAIMRISCSWKLSRPSLCVRFWRDIFFPVCASIVSASSLIVMPLRLKIILTCSPNVKSSITCPPYSINLIYSPNRSHLS